MAAVETARLVRQGLASIPKAVALGDACAPVAVVRATEAHLPHEVLVRVATVVASIPFQAEATTTANAGPGRRVPFPLPSTANASEGS